MKLLELQIVRPGRISVIEGKAGLVPKSPQIPDCIPQLTGISAGMFEMPRDLPGE